MLHVCGVATIVLSKRDLAWKGVGEKNKELFFFINETKE
jgi:hypothetical protein